MDDEPVNVNDEESSSPAEDAVAASTAAGEPAEAAVDEVPVVASGDAEAVVAPPLDAPDAVEPEPLPDTVPVDEAAGADTTDSAPASVEESAAEIGRAHV